MTHPTYTQDPVTTTATALRLVWVSNMDPARAYLAKLSPDELRAAKTVLIRTACLIESVLYQPDSLPDGVDGWVPSHVREVAR